MRFLPYGKMEAFVTIRTRREKKERVRERNIIINLIEIPDFSILIAFEKKKEKKTERSNCLAPMIDNYCGHLL